MTSCVFCQIVRGQTPAHLVLEADHTLGFLDSRPVFPGHVLLVPRTHVETLPDLEPEQVATVFGQAQRLARAMESGFGADGSFVAVNNRISQSVPHLHVHVIPRHRKDGLRGFFWPRQKYASDDQAAEVASRIRAALDAVD